MDGPPTPESSSGKATIEHVEIVKAISFGSDAKQEVPIRPPMRKQLPSEQATTRRRSLVESYSISGVSTRVVLEKFAEHPLEIPTLLLKSHASAKALDEQRQEGQARETIAKLKRPIRVLTPSWFTQVRLYALPQWSDREKKAHEGALRHYHFSNRADVPVHVIDFYYDTAKHWISSTKDFEQLCESKPPNVLFRWLHVSVGKGLFQSTLEDIFLYAEESPRPNTFKQSGIPLWPYPEVNTLSFHDYKRYRERRDALRTLATNDADPSTLDGLTDRMKKDLEWRSGHIGQTLSYWKCIEDDFPSTLSNFSVIESAAGPLVAKANECPERQKLCEHTQFGNALLTTSVLRAFNRSDGFLLTFSNGTGVGYLNKDFDTYLGFSVNKLLDCPEASPLAHAMETFVATGIKRWHHISAEWLLVYIFTEAAITPHNIRSGRNAIPLLDAYGQVMSNLKEKQRRPWAIGESPKLVREYHACLDELRALQHIVESNLKVLRNMVQDVREINPILHETPDPDELIETMEERLDWAIRILEAEDRDIQALIQIFKDILKDLLDLCTVEQNDRAVVADFQQEAIFTFTVVTVVFLPLSFFASYYGMNLSTVRNTDKDENWFWSVCGVAGLVITILAFGFPVVRRHVRELRGRRMPGE